MKNITDELSASGLSNNEINKINDELNKYSNLNPQLFWQQVVKNIFQKTYSFSVHQFLYKAIYPDWCKIPAPTWIPDAEFNATTNVGKYMLDGKFGSFALLHRTTANWYDDIWDSVVKLLNIKFDVAYESPVDISAGVESPRWFPGAKLNIVDSCFQAKNAEIAIIEENALGTKKQISYCELKKLVNRIANSSIAEIKPGDKVAMVMPLTSTAIAIFLAIIKMGACVVPIANDLPIEVIKNQLQLTKPKAIFTQDLYQEFLNADTPPVIVLGERSYKLREQDKVWDKFLNQNDMFTAVSCTPEVHSVILFSTTDKDANVIPWTHITPVKCASDVYFHHNMQPGDIICINTNWQHMAAWLVFSTFINQGCIALYHGDRTSKSFIKFVVDNGVNILGLDPALIASWRANHDMEKYDFQRIKLFHANGDCTDIDDMLYMMSLVHYRPVIEYRYRHDVAGTYVCNIIVEPIAPCAFNTPVFGLAFVILDKNGAPIPDGEVALIPPSIGLSTELLNKNHHQVYYADMPKSLIGQCLRRYGDHIKRYENGFYRLQQ